MSEMTIWEQGLTLDVSIISGLSILCAVILYKLMCRFSTVGPYFDPTQLKTSPSMDSTLRLIKSRRSVFPRDLSGTM